ncbi:hypothetical protein Pyn_30961 [Prunus yedoensis var. nudiflora]|uniref:B3 domain-containing protein n=1 Tax=Prunus yedoensis var. nudiflora TaxID=2094558 RepID=A0A314Z9E0_PRUYE|nr:hypothetical protein Pyn_30961 [Prunus yedoensis var. nudiflora]
MASSSLGSFNLSSRSKREGDKAEDKGKMGYLTMEDFKGMNFDSLCPYDQLTLVATVLVEKTEQEKKHLKNEEHQIQSRHSSSPQVSSSSPNASPHFHPLVSGLVQGKYVNWVQQGYPKKPRSASNFGQKSTMKTSPPATIVAAATHDDHIQGYRRSNNYGLKRKSNDDHDDKDKDWAAPKKKKEKKVYIKNNKGPTLDHHPDLPENFKKMIIGQMNGTELRCLIQKELFKSDVNGSLNRFSLPPNQVLCNDFLTPNEIEALKERKEKKNHDQGSLKSPSPSLKVPFIDPSLKLKEGINLTMWTLSNSETKTYVLRTTWGKVVRENKLVPGDVIQVWSFRANNNQLHLAIVVVKRAGKIGTNQSGRSSSMSGSVVDTGDECGGQGSRGVEGSSEVMYRSAHKIHLSDKHEDEDF